MGGEKLSLKPKTIQIEKVPETSDAETWANFNTRLNDLANQGTQNNTCNRHVHSIE